MKFVTDGTGGPLVSPDITPDMASDRGWGESLSDAFALENSFGSLMSTALPVGDYDPDFDPMSMINEENEEYGPTLAKAKNERDFYRLEEQIRKEQERRTNLQQDGAMGIVSYLAAGVLDPINLVPIGGAGVRAYKTGKILHGLTTGAIAGGGSTVATEAILQGTQVSRTAQESAINIAAGTFLGGVIGGSLGAVKAALDAPGGKGYERVLSDLEDELEVATGTRTMTGSVGAASPDVLPESVALKVDDSIAADVAAGKLTPEQAETETLRRLNDAHKEMSGLKENMPVKTLLRLLPIMKHQTPTMRALTQDSRVGREVMSKLVEHGMERAGDRYVEGTVDLPVEAAIKLWEGKAYKGLSIIDDTFYKYLTGKPEKPFFGAIQVENVKRLGGANAGKLTHGQFKKEIAKAMRNGDAHDVPEVAQAAQKIRKEVYEPLKQEAIDSGYLPEDVAVNPETADSYLNRIWNVDSIQANQPEFLRRIEGWLGAKQADAQIRVGLAEEELAGLRGQLSVLRMQRKDLETSIAKGVQKTIQEKTTEAASKVIEDVDVEGAIPARADVGADAAANRAYTRTLRKELAERLEEAVEGEIEDLSEDVIEATLKRLELDEDVLTGVREELVEPLVDGGKKAGIEALSGDALERAKLAASEAASKAMETSIERRMKEIEKLLDDPALAKEKAKAKVFAEIKRNIREEARAAGREAYKAATKELDEQIKDLTEQLVTRKKQSFIDEIDASLTPGEITQVAEDIMHRITSIGGHRLPHDLNVGESLRKVKGQSGKPSAFKQRSLLVKDNDFEDFLESDVEVLLRRLVDQVAPSLELRKKFGSDVFEETKAYADLYKDWQQVARDRGLMGGDLQKNDKGEFIPTKGAGKKVRQWEKEAARSMNDAAAVFERLKGTYKLPENPASGLNRASLGMRQLNNLRMMGGVMISAIPDIARPVMVHGFSKAFGKGFLPLMTNYAGRKMLARDLHQMGVITDLLLNSRAQKWAGLAEPFGARTKGEQLLGAASDTFSTVNLMSQWNDGVKTMAAMVSHGEIIRLIQKSNGDLNNLKPKEVAYLKSNYIDQGVAQDILSQVQKHGQQDSKGMWFSNVESWENVGAANRFRAAISRDIDRTIITPGQDIPLWASTPLGKMIFQFKSFGVAASEKMLIAGLQQNDANFYSGMLFAISLGSVAYISKEKIAGREVNLDLKTLMLEGVDRSGVVGWLMEPNNILEKASGGNMGLGPMVLDEQLTRYQSRNAVGSLLGPSFGTVGTMLSAFGYMSDWAVQGETPSQQQVESAIRLMPYSNLWYLRGGLEALSD